MVVTGSKFSLEPSLDDASSLLNEGSRRFLAETSVTSTADLSVFSSATRSHAPDTHSAGDGDTGDESGGPETPRASPDVVRIYVPYHSPTSPTSPQNGEVPRPGDHNKIRIVVMDTPSPHEDTATPLAELGPPFKTFHLDQPTVDLKLQAGLSVINNVPSQKFPAVLSRVSQCLQDRPDDLKPFSVEEEEKLSATLGMSGAELRLMLDCCTFILKQAAYNITKPAILQQQLSDNYKLNDDKVEAFVSTWTSQAKNIVGALKRKSVYPKQVEGVSWLLNAAVSGSDGEIMEPRAVVELKLHSDDNARGNLRLDLDSSQLQSLYETLETIQARLDNLR